MVRSGQTINYDDKYMVKIISYSVRLKKMLEHCKKVFNQILFIKTFFKSKRQATLLRNQAYVCDRTDMMSPRM